MPICLFQPLVQFLLPDLLVFIILQVCKKSHSTITQHSLLTHTSTAVRGQVTPQHHHQLQDTSQLPPSLHLSLLPLLRDHRASGHWDRAASSHISKSIEEGGAWNRDTDGGQRGGALLMYSCVRQLRAQKCLKLHQKKSSFSKW